MRALWSLIAWVVLCLGFAAAPTYADDAPAVSFPIARGVQHVEQEIAGVASQGRLPLPRAQLAAESALTYVQARLSPAIHAANGGATDLDSAFRLQAGLCGDIVEAFLQILERSGVRAMPVQFFYAIDGVRQNHVAAQAWWNGGWHYVDPTWGALFERGTRVLSLAQVLQLKHPYRYALMNRLVPWTDASIRRGGGWTPLGYLTEAKQRQVVADGLGTVRPPRVGDDWDLSLMPDYIGTYVPYAGLLVGVHQRLTLPAGRHALTIDSRGKLCGGPGVLHVGPVDVAWDDVPDNGSITVQLPTSVRTLTLWADGGDPTQACAVLLRGLHAA
jgi:hypothetical protein